MRSARWFLALGLILALMGRPASLLGDEKKDPASPPRLITQLGAAGQTTRAALSSDGTLFVSASGNVATVWRIVDRSSARKGLVAGMELRRLVGHRDAIQEVLLTRDGKLAITAGNDGQAIVWDATTGAILRRFVSTSGFYLLRGLDTESKTPKSDPISACALSPDEQWLATAHGTRIRFWHLKSRRRAEHTVKELGQGQALLSFSPDGKRLLYGSQRGIGLLTTLEGDWASKREQSTLADLKGARALVFARDGTSFYLTGPGVKNVGVAPRTSLVKTRLDEGAGDVWQYDLTGKQLGRLTSKERFAPTCLVLSPEGKHLVAGGADGRARLWDLPANRPAAFQPSPHEGGAAIRSVSIRADGKVMLTAGDRGRIYLSNLGVSGPLLMRQEMIGYVPPVRDARLSPNGRWLAVIDANYGRLHLWDLKLGQRARNPWTNVASVAFAPDSKAILIGWRTGGAALIDLTDQSRILQRYAVKGFSGRVQADFRSNGKAVLLVGITPNLDARPPTSEIHLGLFDRDGKREPVVVQRRTPLTFQVQVMHGLDGLVAIGPESGELAVHPLKRGKVRSAITGADNRRALVFSPDDRTAFTDSVGISLLRLIGCSNDVVAWDLETRKHLASFAGHVAPVLTLAVSSDGKHLLSGSADGTARLWDIAGRKSLRILRDGGQVRGVAFSGDGKRGVTISTEGWTRLWNLETGTLLASLAHFHDGTWAVIDPEGRYDASHGGDVEGLHWVIGNTPIALSQLKDRYFEPGLLAKVLGFHKEAVRDVAALVAPGLYPSVTIEQPDRKKPRFVVTLTSQGGGIGPVTIRLNGKEVLADARPRGADPKAKTLKVEVDLSADGRLIPGKGNEVEVVAANAEGFLKGRGMIRRFQPVGRGVTNPPRLWGVVVGVSKYREAALNLRYSAKDAADIAAALAVGGERLFGRDRVHLTLLTSEEKDVALQPTRANLLRVLTALEKAGPEDLVVIYLAGHGVNHGGQDGDFHYLTADASAMNLADPEVRRQSSLSSAELTELLKRSPARKQVLILDTCASGRLIDKLTENREIPSSQVRALERVKDRTGMHILAGCAADAVSYEASRYAQGLLTYALLLGMRGAALGEGDQVDVLRLFGHAVEQVPQLARNIGGIQKPVLASPRGGQSFPIGRVTMEDQARIPLARAHPLVLRSNLQEEEEFNDVLGLARRVDERLRGATDRGGKQGLVFVDALEFPDAYRLAGRYRVEGKKVTIRANLFRAGKRVGQVQVTGEKDRPDELADRLVAEAQRVLATLGE